tara:strand:- start:533 stop:874 length:342 start_codon:yes stop_codon:yes gene_type:complete
MKQIINSYNKTKGSAGFNQQKSLALGFIDSVKLLCLTGYHTVLITMYPIYLAGTTLVWLMSMPQSNSMMPTTFLQNNSRKPVYYVYSQDIRQIIVNLTTHLLTRNLTVLDNAS